MNRFEETHSNWTERLTIPLAHPSRQGRRLPRHSGHRSRASGTDVVRVFKQRLSVRSGSPSDETSRRASTSEELLKTQRGGRKVGVWPDIPARPWCCWLLAAFRRTG